MKKLLSLITMMSLLMSSSQSLISTLTISNVYAAVDTYTVSGGDIGALPDVGAASVSINTITITEDGTNDDFGTVETIRVAINTGSYSNVRFDESIDVFDIVLGGTCGYDLVNLVSYSSNNQIVDINIEDDIFGLGGGDGCLGGETLTIGGLKVVTTAPAVAPGADELISIDNTATSAGNPVASSSTINLAVSAGDSNMTLTLTTPTVGATTNATIAVTVGAMENTDYVQFDVPAHLDITGVAFGSDTFGGAGSFVCTNTAGQTLRCTANGVISTSSGTITMTGVVPQYAAATQLLASGIVFDTSAATNLTSDTTPGTVTDVVAAGANASVVLADPTVGGVGVTTVTLDLPFALDADDTVDMTFPAIVDVSGVGAAVTGTLEGASNITCAAVLQVVTCTTDGATTTGTQTIIMTGITGASVGVDDITVFEVEDEGVAANDIATDTTVALTDVTAAAVQGGQSRSRVEASVLQAPKNLREAKSRYYYYEELDDTDQAQIFLEWDEVSGAISYRLYGMKDGKDWLNESNITLNEYSYDGVYVGSRYVFEVTAINSVGESLRSEKLEFTVEKDSQYKEESITLATPVTPKNLRIDSMIVRKDDKNKLNVQVSWDPVDNADSYGFFFNGSGGTLVNETLNETTKIVENVPHGSGNMWVRSNNKAGSSAWTAGFPFDASPLDVPQKLSSERGDGTAWTLHWDKVSKATRYVVYAADPDLIWKEVAQSEVNSYEFTSLLPQKNYAVVAKNDNLQSGYSETLLVDFPKKKTTVPANELVLKIYNVINTITTTSSDLQGCNGSKKWSTTGSYQKGDVVEYMGVRYQSKGFATSRWGESTTPNLSDAWVKLAKCGETSSLETASYDPTCPIQTPYKMKESGKCVERMPLIEEKVNTCLIKPDSTEKFTFEYNGKTITRGCDFIGRISSKIEGRCASDEAKANCSTTCDACQTETESSSTSLSMTSNACSKDTCSNGGTCTNDSTASSGYTCACKAGYSGTQCDVNIDECENNPCGSNGECTDRVNAYTCSCSVGYSGVNCEIEDKIENICSCQNGVAATGDICTENGASICASCDEGYGLNDEGVCVGNACTVPFMGGRNVIVDSECEAGDLLSHDTTCSFQCADGYSLSGDQPSCFAGVFTLGSVECVPNGCDGTFDGVNRITPPENGVLESCGASGSPFNSLEHEEYCSFSCDSGYRLSDSDPTAQAQCFAGTIEQSKVTCENIDECAEGTHVCQQGCVDTAGSYECTCEEGYEINPDDSTGCVLIRDPDANVVETNSAEVQLGFFGEETTASFCDSNACDNGTCSRENNACECNEGYTGTLCEVSTKPECSTSIDVNGECCESDQINAAGMCCPVGTVVDSLGACVEKEETKRLKQDLGVTSVKHRLITTLSQVVTSSDQSVSIQLENTNAVVTQKESDCDDDEEYNESTQTCQDKSDVVQGRLSLKFIRPAEFTVSQDVLDELTQSIATNTGREKSDVTVSDIKIAGSEILSKRFNANGDLVFRTNVIKDFELLPGAPKATENFSDVIGDPEEASIFELRKIGIISGNPDGMYRPNNSLNRAETSKLISELAGIFPDDAQDGDMWFSAQQRALANSYITNGVIDPVMIENKVNFLALVAKSYNVNITTLPACTEQRFTDVPLGSWYCSLVEFAVKANWIRERDGVFDPAGDVSRSWAAGVIWRTMQMND